MATLHGTSVATYTGPAAQDDDSPWYEEAASGFWHWLAGDGDPMPHGWLDFGPGEFLDLLAVIGEEGLSATGYGGAVDKWTNAGAKVSEASGADYSVIGL